VFTGHGDTVRWKPRLDNPTRDHTKKAAENLASERFVWRGTFPE
jgi:hypothetical protein